MPRVLPDLQRRTVTLDAPSRSIDVPVDGAGHLRRLAKLDSRAVTRDADDATQSIAFKGHAAVFNSRTWIGSRRWGFWEEIAPAAFDKTIREADVRFLHNHDVNLLLARMAHAATDTLRLATDSVGLGVDADMAPTSYATDLAISLERGDVTQMSFAFDMIDYSWVELEDGTELLRHNEVALWDVSTVTYPAYDDTDASLRMDLLAVARSQGFEAFDLDRLARRLANPDEQLLTTLRQLARDTEVAPAAGHANEPAGKATGDTEHRSDTDAEVAQRAEDAARIDALREHRFQELAGTLQEITR